MELYDYICEEIKEIRKERAFTQGEVADALKMSSSFLSTIENGKRRQVSMQTFINLCELYNVSLSTLIQRAETRKIGDDSNG